LTDTALAAPKSPYKGLAAFADSELDALLFFGREREIEIIAANLIAARLTVLYGPSGVGKTSLLRAGVARRLRGEGAAVAVVASWSGDPVGGLLSAVDREVRRVAPDVDSPPPGSVAEILSGWTRRLGADLYLILDQFEEYFLYHGDEAGAGPLAPLADAIREPGARVHVVLSVREDALAQLDAFKSQLPGLFGNSLRLDRLERGAATRAIRGPLERYNEHVPPDHAVEIEDELVDQILDSVEAGRIRLGDAGLGAAGEGLSERGRIEAPYLQLVLERLWEVETERGSKRLQLQTLRDLGGASRIVEDHLERAMAALSPGEKDAAAAMYNHLVTPSGTKIAHRAGDLARYAAVDEREAQRVLERLTSERIVRAGENGTTGTQYEIFHDVLADAVLAWRSRHEADRRLEEERRAASRRHRTLLIVAAASLVALAAMTAITVYALAQRSTSRQNAREARAGELVALAAASLPTDPERSVELALDASRIVRSNAVEDILRKALKEFRARDVVPIDGAEGETSFTTDGTMLASAAGDSVRLFGGPERKLVRTLRHPKALSASFSFDGKRVATNGDDGVTRIWETRTGRLLRSLAHSGPVASAAFSRDGRRILTVSQDRIVRVFDAATGKARTRFVQPSLVMAARFSPDGRLIATGGSDDVARLWDARTGKLRDTLVGHVGRVGDVAFSPDGKLLATGSTDLTARVWNVSDGTLVMVTPGHEGYVSRVEFSPNGEELATGSQDRRARIFDADSPTLRAILAGHDEAVVDLAFSKDGATLSTSSSDGTVRVWDAAPYPVLERVRQHPKPVAVVDFGPDGQRIMSETTAPDDPRLASKTKLAAAIERAGSPTATALSGDGRLAVSGYEDGAARIWDVESAKPLRDLTPHRGPVTSATFSPDERSVVTTGADHQARLSDVKSGAQVWVLSHAAIVSDADFSADGRWVVTAGPGYAGVVDAKTGERMLLLDGKEGKDRVLTAAAFSPAGWRIATGGQSGVVRTYDCRLCGHIDDLVELAQSRLAQLRTKP
jgi:WD40 repeat protein